MSAISLRLPDDLTDRLNILSKETGRTKTYYITELLEKHLEDIEDIYLSMQVIERVRKGQEKIYSNEEFKKRLGL